MKKLLIFCTALLLLLAGCNKVPEKLPEDNRPAVELPETGEIRAASSYEEIKQLIAASAQTYENAARQPSSAPSAEELTGSTESGVQDYSGTNVQVEGIDEGDVVKTDGQYIYILGTNNLLILRADGENTALLSTTILDLVRNQELESGRTLEMFVTENRLTILVQVDEWGTKEEAFWSNQSTLHVLTYDTSDKAAPKLLSETIQDGAYQASRLLDGTIYLITDKYTYMTDDRPEEEYLPCAFNGGTRVLLPAESIYLCPQTETYSFTILSAIAAESGQQLSTCAFTDGTDTVYMNSEGLYLARTVYSSGASEPYIKDQYTVVDYLSEEQTEIRRVKLTDGTLTLDASCSVPGRLLNQFSLDVYNGYLRVATSESGESYSVYTDEAYGFSNTVWNDSVQNTAVTVLDDTLQQVGKIDTLAEDERIYSVRFMGEVGYVVTFKNIDPLFTLNLSDPAKPVISSELKVAGVSRYLQSYKDGLLLGFGEAIDESGSSDGLQLNMFDTSDAANVKLLAQSVLEGNWSEALYNHKAIMVEPDKNLIAFSEGSGSYLIYSYIDGSFTQKGSFTLDYMPADARGLYIGSCLYICSQDAVYAVDMDSFATLSTLNFAMG